MAVELGTAYVNVVPSGRGIGRSLADELGPVDRAQKRIIDSNSRLTTSFHKLGDTGANLGVPFSRSLNVIGNHLDKTSGQAKGLQATLSRIGGAQLFAAGAGFAAIAGSSIKAGSDLNESLSRTRVILGAAAEDVIDFAKKAASSLGLSQKAALDGAATFAAFGKSAGLSGEPLGEFSVKLTKLASDMASFNNTTPEEAIVAIGAALRGEQEPIRAYNILLDDATLRQRAVRLGLIATTKDALTPQNRVLAANSEIFAQAGDQIDDFKRTQGGLANQTRIMTANFQNLQANLGSVLVPKLLAAQQGALATAHGFQSANDATNGWLGKIAAAAAALPVVVFGIEKLNVAGVKIAGQYKKVGEAFGSTATGAEDFARSGAKASKSTDQLVAGAAGATTSFGGLGLAIGATAGALLLLNDQSKKGKSIFDNLPFFDGNNIFGQRGGLGSSGAELGQKEAGAQFVVTGLATAEAADRMGKSVDQASERLRQYTLNVLAGAEGGKRFAFSVHDNIASTEAQSDAFLSASLGVDQTVASLNGAQKAQLRYTLALAQYQSDVAPGAHTSSAQLKEDADELAAAQKAVAGIQSKTNAALEKGAKSADDAAFAYLGFGESVKTAADALKAIQTRAFAKIELEIDVSSAKSDLNDAIAALHEAPESSGGGGGGSGQTATAAAIERTQKELARRDALVGVEDAARGVTDAEKALTQARHDQATADRELVTAEEKYRTVLQGVARDSAVARKATDDLAQAKRDAAGAKLDVNASKRALAIAKNDKELLAIAVRDARRRLQELREGTEGTTQFVPTATGSKEIKTGGTGPGSADEIRKAQIALNDAIIAQGGANDTVKRAELELANTRKAAKDKTKDLSEAQRILNGTLDGFPRSSREAKQAQQELTTAQNSARDAARTTADAYRGLQDAQRQTADASLALKRANADLSGALDSVGGAASSSGKKLDTFGGKLDNAKQKAIDAATVIASQIPRVAQLPVLGVLSMIDTLQAIIEREPLLAASLGPAIQSIENDLRKLQAKSGSAAQFLKNLPNSSIGSQHRARGGSVEPGRLYRVGEQGEEWFVPQVAGTIVPHSALANSKPVPIGGGGMNVNLTVQSLDPRTAGPVVIEALEHISKKNGSLPRTIRTAT